MRILSAALWTSMGAVLAWLAQVVATTAVLQF